MVWRGDRLKNQTQVPRMLSRMSSPTIIVQTCWRKSYCYTNTGGSGCSNDVHCHCGIAIEKRRREKKMSLFGPHICCRPWRPRLRPFLVAIARATRQRYIIRNHGQQRQQKTAIACTNKSSWYNNDNSAKLLFYFIVII